MEVLGWDIPLWLLFLLAIITLLHLYSSRDFNVWKEQGVPGPKPKPFIGNVLDFVGKSIVDLDMGNKQKYGNIVGKIVFGSPSLTVSDPEFLRQAMIKDFSVMPNRLQANLPGVLSLMLTALKDDHWRHVRNSLTPIFTTGKLKQMKPLVDSCGAGLISNLKKTNGKPFNVKQVTGNYTMDVIASTAFGIQVDSQEDPDSPIIRYAKRMMGSPDAKGTIWKQLSDLVRFGALFAPKFLKPWLDLVGVRSFDVEATEYFEKLVDKVLDERSESESDSGRRDFVQHCIDQQIDVKRGDPSTHENYNGVVWSEKGLTRPEIVANALIFFLAGYETTAQSLQFFFYEMAQHPEIQEEVYEEIKRVSKSDKPSYEQIGELHLLERCLQETMRLYPAAFRLDRLLSEDYTINGVTIKAGQVISAAVYVIHHDPEIWPDPEEFQPDRFTPENKANRHPCAWIPFGIGNRNCIGMRLALLEMKMACVKILWNFKLETCDETPTRPIKWGRNLGLIPEKPIMLKAISR